MFCNYRSINIKKRSNCLLGEPYIMILNSNLNAFFYRILSKIRKSTVLFFICIFFSIFSPSQSILLKIRNFQISSLLLIKLPFVGVTSPAGIRCWELAHRHLYSARLTRWQSASRRSAVEMSVWFEQTSASRAVSFSSLAPAANLFSSIRIAVSLSEWRLSSPMPMSLLTSLYIIS